MTRGCSRLKVYCNVLIQYSYLKQGVPACTILYWRLNLRSWISNMALAQTMQSETGEENHKCQSKMFYFVKGQSEMRKHGALLNGDILKCTWHSKGFTVITHFQFSTHEVEPSFMFSKCKWIKRLYSFKIKIRIKPMGCWKENKQLHAECRLS